MHVFSVSFEYVCYVSTAIIYITLSVQGSTLDVRFWRLKEIPHWKGYNHYLFDYLFDYIYLHH